MDTKKQKIIFKPEKNPCVDINNKKQKNHIQAGEKTALMWAPKLKLAFHF